MKEPKGRNAGHIFDYSRITDKIIIGSDLCKGGVCLIHGEEFKKLGVQIEINLSQENNELPPKDIETYLWIPVVDGYSPTLGQLKIGTCLMDSAISQGKKVYVHCKNGHARSPTLVAAYLIKYQGMNVEDAINLINEKRPESHVEKNQKVTLEEFAKRINS